MTTLKLVVTLIALNALAVILIFLIPWLLNAPSSLLNSLGITVVISCIISFIAVVYHNLTQEK